MRRGGFATVAVLVALPLAGCGDDDDAPAASAFPTTAAVEGDVLVAAVEDPGGDAEEPVVDLRRASLEHRRTTLTVRLELAEPPTVPTTATPGDEASIHVGAYLLRDPDDAEPVVARAVLRRGRPPAYRWGPWLERGGPASGTVDGRTVSVTVEDVPAGRYRYVEFFAESARTVDVAPDDTPDAAGVVAIDPAG